jgi:hypothetical protein
MASVERGQIDDEAAYAAIEALHHAYLTGLILMLVTRVGADKAAEVVFRTFRRQQLARFVSGLRKLGIDNRPHAVACAQYHYLSNWPGSAAGRATILKQSGRPTGRSCVRARGG